MINILNDYFWIVLIASGLLMVLTIVTRVKLAKVKRDKVLYNIYSVILVVVFLLLIAYKMDFFR
ncbi:hypothetical protein CEQ21_07860 (plasmid) [Niallia circulans]|uniref:Uncharacterized protein n=1 Tax=Niallia circulans TaxID=1397 RepID=A0A553SQK3_NIACI|nr:hypothetical protein CEQ21_07860 [Niallia circulans]